MIRLFLSGEGSNELGSRCPPEEGDSFADDAFHPGVMEKLIEKVRPGGWEIREAVRWKDIKKLRVNSPGTSKGERENVRRLLFRAKERGCHAVVFLRDRDGNKRREKTIAKAVRTYVRTHGKKTDQKLSVADGVPIEMLESWLLALMGEEKSEQNPDPVSTLTAKGIPEKRTTAMVQVTMNAKLRDIPKDATSLRKWLRKLAQGLNVKVPKNWP